MTIFLRYRHGRFTRNLHENSTTTRTEATKSAFCANVYRLTPYVGGKLTEFKIKVVRILFTLTGTLLRVEAITFPEPLRSRQKLPDGARVIGVSDAMRRQKQILPPSGNGSRDVVVTTDIRALTKFCSTVRWEMDERR